MIPLSFAGQVLGSVHIEQVTLRLLLWETCRHRSRCKVTHSIGYQTHFIISVQIDWLTSWLTLRLNFQLNLRLKWNGFDMQLSEELCVCVCELLADADTKLLAHCERTLNIGVFLYSDYFGAAYYIKSQSRPRYIPYYCTYMYCTCNCHICVCIETNRNTCNICVCIETNRNTCNCNVCVCLEINRNTYICIMYTYCAHNCNICVCINSNETHV